MAGGITTNTLAGIAIASLPSLIAFLILLLKNESRLSRIETKLTLIMEYFSLMPRRETDKTRNELDRELQEDDQCPPT